MMLSAALRSICYKLHHDRRKVGVNALSGLLTLGDFVTIIGREGELCTAMRQRYGRFAMNM